jgi:Ca2+-binding EF-hand superfamily protein
LSIRKNLVDYAKLSTSQKIVLSLISGLNATEAELKELQEEFLRLDQSNTGTLSIEDLKKMHNSTFGKKFLGDDELDWETVVKECDLNGDGVIDF